ncbi:hypothetical protein E2C01_009802 [Portunus trituberculatus]|uniref:Uncharacterized protein n=1 Tax=Portunus trituberculatus TaxID=210409 RepID=A0A5B7D6Q2_PORTR|nr:hypothetical protein [Portunus trituberculatus]
MRSGVTRPSWRSPDPHVRRWYVHTRRRRKGRRIRRGAAAAAAAAAEGRGFAWEMEGRHHDSLFTPFTPSPPWCAGRPFLLSPEYSPPAVPAICIPLLPSTWPPPRP